MRIALLAVIALTALTILSLPAFCDTAGMFPFVIPWDDSTKGVAADVSFLNDAPAGSHGFIVVKDGHFAESKTGKRIRFFGVNITETTLYMDHATADKVVAHLVKLGINFVRIHRHDGYELPLWKKDHSGFDPDALDRLDYLIAALERHGIYVDLNLHVSRAYNAEDGFPMTTWDFVEPCSKRIDNLDPKMIALQKKFAADYLTHRNPYTGLRYVDDPGVAFIEINNENAFSGGVRSDEGTYYFNSLPTYFRSEVVAAWNAFLSHKYATTAQLATAWTLPGMAAGASGDLLNADTKWHLYDKGNAGVLTVTGQGTANTAPQVEAAYPATSNSLSERQLLIGGLDFTEGGVYSLTFRARADKPVTFPVSADLGQPDWHEVGPRCPVSTKPDWQTYRFLFQVSNTVPKACRLKFIIPSGGVTVDIADLRLRPAISADILGPGESLEARTIDLPALTIGTEGDDWHRFLVATDVAYASDMRDYVRNTLKAHALITDTQESYGKLSGLAREAGSDYADMHAYWSYPHFPPSGWSYSHWSETYKPMTDAIVDGSHDTFEELAANRIAGKPFCVSEYNHCAPSDFQAEALPEIASFAALQDWDCVCFYTFGEYFNDKPRDSLHEFFTVQGNPAREGFWPAAAIIFREGGIGPLQAGATLHLPLTAPATFVPAMDEWSKTSGGRFPDLIANRLAMTLDPQTEAPQIANSQNGPASSWAKASGTDGSSSYVAAGPGAIAAAGYFGGRTLAAGPLTMTFPQFGNNFASITLTALDGKPIAQSRHMLLTLCGRAEDLDMNWNADRTSVGADWGHGPIQAEGIPATIRIESPNVSHIWALDPTGARVKEVVATVSGGALQAVLGPEERTIWYEIGK